MHYDIDVDWLLSPAQAERANDRIVLQEKAGGLRLHERK